MTPFARRMRARSLSSMGRAERSAAKAAAKKSYMRAAAAETMLEAREAFILRMVRTSEYGPPFEAADEHGYVWLGPKPDRLFKRAEMFSLMPGSRIVNNTDTLCEEVHFRALNKFYRHGNITFQWTDWEVL